MSKCKAGQDASAILALNLESFDKEGRLVKVPLPSAASDLEIRRNELAQLLIDMKDATALMEQVARTMGRSEDLVVLSQAELEQSFASVESSILEHRPIRGYGPGISFKRVSQDYRTNQIYFHAARQAFERVEAAIRNKDSE
ncbi:hypothetical protein [Sinorhizobium meliloti]|uniref:hypothetical protein n=1 Tax=Rhizobium meliloti TaxID=382 RepID=UPI00048A3F92|nr:hypothetical protein [Sinorhizobium meliloti]